MGTWRYVTALGLYAPGWGVRGSECDGLGYVQCVIELEHGKVPYKTVTSNLTKGNKMMDLSIELIVTCFSFTYQQFCD